MNAYDPGRPARRKSPDRPRRTLARALVVALLAVVCFLLGVAFAETLRDRPREGNTVTTIATLPPVTAPDTVTVTVTSP